MNKLLGILGGMGPLASTAFLQTIYRKNIKKGCEQDYPNVILHSIPTIPNRCDAVASKRRLFENILANSLQTINISPVSKIVVCCVTSHQFFYCLPFEISNKIISLVDVIKSELDKLEEKKSALLLASKPTYQAGLFDDKHIITPSDADKQYIHDIIYNKLKPGLSIEPIYEEISWLLAEYNTDTFIAGCTEFHLLTNFIESNGLGGLGKTGMNFIDPLMTIAENLRDLLETKYN